MADEGFGDRNEPDSGHRQAKQGGETCSDVFVHQNAPTLRIIEELDYIKVPIIRSQKVGRDPPGSGRMCSTALACAGTPILQSCGLDGSGCVYPSRCPEAELASALVQARVLFWGERASATDGSVPRSGAYVHPPRRVQLKDGIRM